MSRLATLAGTVLLMAAGIGRSQEQSAATQPAGSAPAARPAARSADRLTPAAPATRAAATRPGAPRAGSYTSPGAVVRGGSLLSTAALLQVGTAAQAVTGPRELSEARVTRPLAASPGVAGLTPPNSGFASSTIRSPSFIGGRPGGLGFASSNNLLTARPNPAGGVNGQCAALAGGGFSGGPAMCVLPGR